MRPKEIIAQGIPRGEPLEIAIKTLKRIKPKKGAARKILYKVASNPEYFSSDQDWGELAKAIYKLKKAKKSFVAREAPAPYKIWGTNIEPEAIKQLVTSCMLPISVRAALMPDGHLGYGLPIGGVLAVKGAVIPYAVGVDIACRMRLSVYNQPISLLETKRDKIISAIEKETRFGVGAEFKDKLRKHQVMDEDWDFCKAVKSVKDKAAYQLGTSGSGNHFADFGELMYLQGDDVGIKKLALLTHSGSRGPGGIIAQHFSKVAKKMHPGLPKELLHLAWLDMGTEEGQQYWKAMQLMGKYAAANHELIHKHIQKNLGYQVIKSVENHHNFAWKEKHFGENVIVHRKGATPAGPGVLGIIPGSMGTPGYVVKGKGCPESLHSCSHGAGRRMSRKQAKEKFDWKYVRKFLTQNRVHLISGSLDECPQAYKDIDTVISEQSDLISVEAKFIPRIVKMA
jgi:tRNA-splicing ligase RtcB